MDNRIAEEILGKMNKRDVGGINPEWALSDKDYQYYKHLGYTRPEPAEDMVEAVAVRLWLFHINRARLFDPTVPVFTEDDFRQQQLIDHDSFVWEAREILQLCQPELTLIENKYPITGRLNDPDYMDGIARDAYAEGCADQLVHDQKTMRGE